MAFSARDNYRWIYALSFLVSFCSIIYELILAQCLAILLGNTVGQYSITIGLYIFALGMGALAIAWREPPIPAMTLLRVELFLSAFGILLPFTLFFGDYTIRSWTIGSGYGELPTLGFLYGSILLVGFLSGLELPLLIGMLPSSKGQRVLALDYLGSFFGAMLFPLCLFEGLGLVATAGLVGAINAAGALVIALCFAPQRMWGVSCWTLTLVVLGWLSLAYEEMLRSLLVEALFG